MRKLKQPFFFTVSMGIVMGVVSLMGIETSAARSDFVMVDDFSHYSVKAFPTGNGNDWRIFSLINFETENYFIEEESGNKFLRAIVPMDLERKKKAITLIKRVFKGSHGQGDKTFYMPKDYPVLSWRWRVHKLPTGSDERIENQKTKKSDSAAGVYIYFQKEGQNPHIIKYIWSEALPIGLRYVSPASKDIYIAHLVVLKSGPMGLGEWHQERVNIYDDFKKEFSEKGEPPRILGVGILTDADSTDTEAAADYDDFILMKE